MSNIYITIFMFIIIVGLVCNIGRIGTASFELELLEDIPSNAVFTVTN